MKFLASILMASLLAVGFGCSKDTKPAANNAKSEPAEHTHGAGPNGGVVFDFGSHHAEFTVDHGRKECTIVVLGADEKTPTPVATKEIILNTKETKTADGTVVAPMTITMQPVDIGEGKTSKFVGTDPGLGNVADFQGIVSGEIDTKPAMGEFKE